MNNFTCVFSEKRMLLLGLPSEILLATINENIKIYDTAALALSHTAKTDL